MMYVQFKHTYFLAYKLIELHHYPICSIQAQFIYLGAFIQVSVPFRHISWEYNIIFAEVDAGLMVGM